MTLIERISEDMKTAMKDKAEQALSTLRLIKAALKYKQIELMRELQDDDVLSVLNTQVKQLSEALEGAIKARRDDLKQKAEAELAIIKTYLPKELDDAELTAAVQEVITDIGQTQKDAGKLMGLVMQRVKGRANGTRVRQKVEEILQKM